MTTHAGGLRGTLCGTRAKSYVALGQGVDCADCLAVMDARAHDPQERALELARELVTLRLLDEDDYEDRVTDALRPERPAVIESLIFTLVEGLAATWDNADDFSAHVIRALADLTDDPEETP